MSDAGSNAIGLIMGVSFGSVVAFIIIIAVLIHCRQQRLMQ